MPDTPVAPPPGGPYDPLMEARVSRLEDEMREEKLARARLEASVVRIEAMLAATLPNLVTKADLAELRSELKGEAAEFRSEIRTELAVFRAEFKSDVGTCNTNIAACKSELKLDIARLDANKPGKAYMWLIMTALLAAYASGLAALAVLR